MMYSLTGKTQVRHSSGKLKELNLRIKSVTTIQKITKTMNMISAAKYTKAVKTLGSARGFGLAGAGVVNVLSQSEKYVEPEGNHVVLISSSDRGLCGALHNNVAREAALVKSEKGENCKYVCMGEKSKVAIIAMKQADNILISCKDVCRNPPTFADAGSIAQALIESGYDWKSGTILYNKHRSAMTQIITRQSIVAEEGLRMMPGIELYDSVDEDVIRNFTEFALASTIYGLIKENYISEQAARMVSMDGAAKNATEMIAKMKLKYNRLRQAVITTELCEIIAGMSAL